MKSNKRYFNLLLTTIVALVIGAILMLILGHNPIEAYVELFRGAFVGKQNIGTALQKFLPLLLTAMAFAVAAKVGIFNVGVEGELVLGGLGAAIIGYKLTNLPGPLIIVIAIGVAMIVGAGWASIPGLLKSRLGVNEICVTILMNYVAMNLASYLVNGPFRGGAGTPRTPEIPGKARFGQFLYPSQAHFGLIVGVIVVIFIIWFMAKSTWGYKLTSVGLNPKHAEYIGINPKNAVLAGMMLSGAIGGLAGSLEVLGTFGYFLDNFSSGVAFDGMLAALIVKNDLKMVPFMAFFLAVLKTGALGMERQTGVPKAVVDMIIAIFIIFATMETLFDFLQKRKAKTAPAAKAQTN